MEERTIAFARDLERRDAELAAAIDEVAELQRAIEELRARAEQVATFLASWPREREAAHSAVQRAREELERRRQDAGRAEQALDEAERSGKEERLETARRALERARDTLGLAETRLARAEEEVARLAREEEAARAEVPELEERARTLAARLASLPRLSREGAEPPAAGLDGVIAWASQARAALWVVRSGLESERERVVREANELAASVLGEPLATTSVATVRERLERAAS